jgi:hypothetical protein
MPMKILSFNAGLEQIFIDAPAPVPEFPRHKQLTPAGDGIFSHMGDLFEGHDSDRQLENFIKPEITRRELLTAEGFNRQYAAVHEFFLQGAGEPTPASGNKLSDAAALLENAMGNIDLLNMYRNILLKA